MKLSRFLLLIICVYSYQFAVAQNKTPVKFGVVSAKDFETKVYSLDSNASAVIIADVGSCTIEGNLKGWFSAVNKHYRRIHILNKNGYDLANVSINLYSNGADEERLEKLKAVTYNLVNGKVVETKLDTKSSVFEDKIDKKRTVKKFTFPNIKEGSIIEYEYSTISDFINSPDTWAFQGSYPRLWSEFTFNAPEFFNYTFLTQGYLAYTVKETNVVQDVFTVSDLSTASASKHASFIAYVNVFRWAIKDVPALKEESFTTSIDNHIQKIAFELVERKSPLTNYTYIDSWPKVAQQMMDYDKFGSMVQRDNGWLKEIIQPLISAGDDQEVKAKKIYAWVRDNFTCTDKHRLLMDQNLKNLVKSRNGTDAEINLLLTAMLRYVDITADPVILSTRDNGFAYSNFPIMSQYNYVICRAVVNGNDVLLDATEPLMGYGQLPLRCYNGYARAMNTGADLINLYADRITETKNTLVFIINDESGKYTGSLQQTSGVYGSMDIREKIKSKGMESFQKDIKQAMGSDMSIYNFGIDSLNNYNAPIDMHYEFDMENNGEDIIYLSPLFGEAYKENPFKAAERRYPVEMPYCMDEIISVQLEVPRGYVVDELPKSMVLKLNEDGDGIFDYRVSQAGENISLQCRIQLKRANFAAEEYQLLREFFTQVVKKEGEQMVFKKKK